MADVCEYCKSELAEGATKCAACGEWVGGRDPEKPSHLFTFVAVALIAFVAMMILLGMV